MEHLVGREAADGYFSVLVLRTHVNMDSDSSPAIRRSPRSWRRWEKRQGLTMEVLRGGASWSRGPLLALLRTLASLAATLHHRSASRRHNLGKRAPGEDDRTGLARVWAVRRRPDGGAPRGTRCPLSRKNTARRYANSCRVHTGCVPSPPAGRFSSPPSSCRVAILVRRGRVSSPRLPSDSKHSSF